MKGKKGRQRKKLWFTKEPITNKETLVYQGTNYFISGQHVEIRLTRAAGWQRSKHQRERQFSQEAAVKVRWSKRWSKGKTKAKVG